ncbi:Nuclear nucleic acid-binding protein C1D, partial [Armadillidium vulgare]
MNNSVNDVQIEGVKKNESENLFPPGMASKILNLVKGVDELEKVLEPLITKPHHEVLSNMSHLEKSKIGLLETYVINSLFWAMMKVSKDEVNPSVQEDFKLEMTHLKEIQSRIAEVESRFERPQVNSEVASRMIKRGLGKQVYLYIRK